MSILLTGGAGFIGSHTAVSLLNAGQDIVIVDNLYNSSPKVIDRIEKITGKRPPFVEADCCDQAPADRHCGLLLFAPYFLLQIPIILWPFPASFFQNIRNFLEILARLPEDRQHTVAMHHLRAGGHCIGNLCPFACLLKVRQRTV